MKKYKVVIATLFMVSNLLNAGGVASSESGLTNVTNPMCPAGSPVALFDHPVIHGGTLTHTTWPLQEERCEVYSPSSSAVTTALVEVRHYNQFPQTQRVGGRRIKGKRKKDLRKAASVLLVSPNGQIFVEEDETCKAPYLNESKKDRERRYSKQPKREKRPKSKSYGCQYNGRK